jgi:rRNA biogenesis protein RRP5
VWRGLLNTFTIGSNEIALTLLFTPRFKDGDFVLCRVLQRIRGSPVVEVSLRPSRIEGDIDNDEKPVPGNLVSGYVIETNKKGCFVRLSREAEARSTLKELCDGFIADPAASFPRGRLIAAKVKDVRSIKSDKTGIRYQVDIDMRESKLGDGDTMTFEQVETGSKYDGVITRTERYGVFVSLDSSDVSVFVHLTECCEQRMSNPASHFAPGDRVKVMITAKDVDKRRISGSMKAKHFEDNDSDDDSYLLCEADEMDIDADKGDVEEVDNREKVDDDDDDDDSHVDGDSDSDDGSSGSSSGDDDTDSSADAASAEEEALDTNVGFDWTGTTVLSKKEEALEESGSESSDDEEEDGDGNEKKMSKRSRKKHSERRKHEQSIASREAALADGTADENPETAADYERLLASQPNSSELWIRFMALHLGLADVLSARKVAERALDRIEFRLETEKLNVWCALLMLEMKYGDEASLKAARENACKHNNPKHIHLRMCEMYEKASIESPSVESTAKADEMFELTCKRFKDKKKVWMAQLEYLLKSRRQEEAFDVSKRALKSLKPYKHTETMSKFAQLMFQYGSAEKARTIFEGLLRQNPKRLDIFSVYADKEIKHGDADAARALFSKVANRLDTSIPLKLTDKQMKSFFKKWFHFEEAHGTEQTCEAVKAAARKYVQG